MMGMGEPVRYYLLAVSIKSSIKLPEADKEWVQGSKKW